MFFQLFKFQVIFMTIAQFFANYQQYLELYYIARETLLSSTSLLSSGISWIPNLVVQVCSAMLSLIKTYCLFREIFESDYMYNHCFKFCFILTTLVYLISEFPKAFIGIFTHDYSNKDNTTFFDKFVETLDSLFGSLASIGFQIVLYRQLIMKKLKRFLRRMKKKITERRLKKGNKDDDKGNRIKDDTIHNSVTNGKVAQNGLPNQNTNHEKHKPEVDDVHMSGESPNNQLSDEITGDKDSGINKDVENTDTNSNQNLKKVQESTDVSKMAQVASFKIDVTDTHILKTNSISAKKYEIISVLKSKLDTTKHFLIGFCFWCSCFKYFSSCDKMHKRSISSEKVDVQDVQKIHNKNIWMIELNTNIHWNKDSTEKNHNKHYDKTNAPYNKSINVYGPTGHVLTMINKQRFKGGFSRTKTKLLPKVNRRPQLYCRLEYGHKMAMVEAKTVAITTISLDKQSLHNSVKKSNSFEIAMNNTNSTAAELNGYLIKSEPCAVNNNTDVCSLGPNYPSNNVKDSVHGLSNVGESSVTFDHTVREFSYLHSEANCRKSIDVSNTSRQVEKSTKNITTDLKHSKETRDIVESTNLDLNTLPNPYVREKETRLLARFRDRTKHMFCIKNMTDQPYTSFSRFFSNLLLKLRQRLRRSIEINPNWKKTLSDVEQGITHSMKGDGTDVGIYRKNILTATASTSIINDTEQSFRSSCSHTLERKRVKLLSKLGVRVRSIFGFHNNVIKDEKGIENATFEIKTNLVNFIGKIKRHFSRKINFLPVQNNSNTSQTDTYTKEMDSAKQDQSSDTEIHMDVSNDIIVKSKPSRNNKADRPLQQNKNSASEIKEGIVAFISSHISGILNGVRDKVKEKIMSKYASVKAFVKNPAKTITQKYSNTDVKSRNKEILQKDGKNKAGRKKDDDEDSDDDEDIGICCIIQTLLPQSRAGSTGVRLPGKLNENKTVKKMIVYYEKAVVKYRYVMTLKDNTKEKAKSFIKKQKKKSIDRIRDYLLSKKSLATGYILGKIKLFRSLRDSHTCEACRCNMNSSGIISIRDPPDETGHHEDRDQQLLPLRKETTNLYKYSVFVIDLSKDNMLDRKVGITVPNDEKTNLAPEHTERENSSIDTGLKCSIPWITSKEKFSKDFKESKKKVLNMSSKISFPKHVKSKLSGLGRINKLNKSLRSLRVKLKSYINTFIKTNKNKGQLLAKKRFGLVNSKKVSSCFNIIRQKRMSDEETRLHDDITAISVKTHTEHTENNNMSTECVNIVGTSVSNLEGCVKSEQRKLNGNEEINSIKPERARVHNHVNASKLGTNVKTLIVNCCTFLSVKKENPFDQTDTKVVPASDIREQISDNTSNFKIPLTIMDISKDSGIHKNIANDLAVASKSTVDYTVDTQSKRIDVGSVKIFDEKAKGILLQNSCKMSSLAEENTDKTKAILARVFTNIRLYIVKICTSFKSKMHNNSRFKKAFTSVSKLSIQNKINPLKEQALQLPIVVKGVSCKTSTSSGDTTNESLTQPKTSQNCPKPYYVDDGMVPSTSKEYHLHITSSWTKHHFISENRILNSLKEKFLSWTKRIGCLSNQKQIQETKTDTFPDTSKVTEAIKSETKQIPGFENIDNDTSIGHDVDESKSTKPIPGVKDVDNNESVLGEQSIKTNENLEIKDIDNENVSVGDERQERSGDKNSSLDAKESKILKVNRFCIECGKSFEATILPKKHGKPSRFSFCCDNFVCRKLKRILNNKQKCMTISTYLSSTHLLIYAIELVASLCFFC